MRGARTLQAVALALLATWTLQAAHGGAQGRTEHIPGRLGNDIIREAGK